ncbi:prolactin-releasing peptide receptor-like [Pseudomyrmex gracilis]|uniref:prolactin-releasing peptide receptor-like n=1 Tax=Pseudomyrmex gracilis TaxID=219809 RepID=UPI0009952C17|nr:prolactin-releasing peptide receptor-like [Pseudomyrmex gracilis]XP_020291920.1 prolactin-releasing peptide receptor-like [Pseudomyrmex gracilis]XP_020291922.1 prolactin-releasing peptide receptor-like [Pseudomyrmex gracilis]XP_020291923.1 prolactin-releasing peptide receptor-like [Pseudomyrmex gracilis]XP_020291924.1 prolactin-releasing peptide receptor-like [Pseudomyrmex gracilis]XP_020291925.1 prolactin-releasing peptide receptor-like [Pseudomyrmex gracilis]XP_020291926.1 prolactin-rele
MADDDTTRITSRLTMQNLSVARNFSNYPTEDLTSNLAVQIVFCMFYVIIFVLGIFGNVLVVFVVQRNRHMHTVTNFFITNLALSDVLLCVLAVPFTPLYTFMGGWVFGKTLCHLVPYAQGVSVYISTFTLTSIAADRFQVIIYPFRPRMKIEMCMAIIIGIWVIALLFTLPYGLYMQLEEPYVFCEEHWPSEPLRKTFSLLTTILQFVVPFFVITFCYVCVSMKLKDRARAKPGSKTSKREEADRERKRRTNWMLIAMVFIFGMSWLPLNIVNVVDDFFSSANDWSYYRLCFFMSHCLAMSSTCYNPFLYAWLNENFRKEFKQVLPCFSRGSNRNIQRTREGCRGDKICNGNNTMQETLLPTSNTTKAQNPEGCELIILEPTTNISKEQEEIPSSSSKDFDDAAL